MKRLATILGVAALVLAIVPSTFAAAKPTQSIVQIATANGNFKTLLAAVGCADAAVGKALTGTAHLTVFAPTDAAFAKAGLTADNVCSALSKSKVTRILLYHVLKGDVLSGRVLPAKWSGITTLHTLNGQPLWAIRTGSLFTTSGTTATILVKEKLFDIRATNGVIHVIDSVLLPRL
jgi:uncharacterized surface protein with fasciclin (FAS1) repeats